jgi:hypothetical protein
MSLEFKFALGCGCGCAPPCNYSLCVETVDRCRELFVEGGLPLPPSYVATTVTFDGPNAEHHEITTGGGGTVRSVACISNPAAGLWTVTAEADGWQTATGTVTVVECVNSLVRLQLCPFSASVTVLVTGCMPPASCGPLTITLTGPGVITPASVNYWDVWLSGGAVFDIDLDGVTLDGDCTATLDWTATVTPPEDSGIAAASATITGSACAAGATIDLAPPSGSVCCNGVAIPDSLDFSDDWGTATLTYGAECNITAYWLPGSPLLSSVAPWIGTMTFTCEDGCDDSVPCYGEPGLISGSRSVTVTVASSCPNGAGKVYKLFDVRRDCDGVPCLHSVTPMGGNPAYLCRAEGTNNSDPCSSDVLSSGSWAAPFLGCSTPSGRTSSLPCVGGNWTITG